MHRPSPFSGPFPVADFGPSFPRATSHCSPAYSYDRFSSEIHSGFSSAEPIFTELNFSFRKSPLVAFPLLLQLPVEHPLRLTLMGFLWLSFLHRETEPLETGSCDWPVECSTSDTCSGCQTINNLKRIICAFGGAQALLQIKQNNKQWEKDNTKQDQSMFTKTVSLHSMSFSKPWLWCVIPSQVHPSYLLKPKCKALVILLRSFNVSLLFQVLDKLFGLRRSLFVNHCRSRDSIYIFHSFWESFMNQRESATFIVDWFLFGSCCFTYYLDRNQRWRVLAAWGTFIGGGKVLRSFTVLALAHSQLTDIKWNIPCGRGLLYK